MLVPFPKRRTIAQLSNPIQFVEPFTFVFRELDAILFLLQKLFDTVFVLHPDTILTYIDKDNGAPIQAYEELRELNFSFVGSNHQLMVNVNELNSRINKRRVYVTISDIPDMNGNLMASPATVAIFVDRNPLRWSRRQLTLANLESGEEHTFNMSIANNSGANHTYTIENLPKWMTVDTPSDVIDPKEESELLFTISKDVNVGTYDNIIYLTDENGLYEPLTLNITITGEKPNWMVSDDMKQYSMSVVGRVQIKDEVVTDARDMVGVFDNTGRCMGVANVKYDAVSAEALVYLNVYDSTITTRPLEFRLWHYDTGKTMVLTPSQTITFNPNTIVGTAKSPVVLKAGDDYIQQLDLVKGWNWIAFDVYSNDFRNGKEMLNRWSWTEGDHLLAMNGAEILGVAKVSSHLSPLFHQHRRQPAYPAVLRHRARRRHHCHYGRRPHLQGRCHRRFACRAHRHQLRTGRPSATRWLVLAAGCQAAGQAPAARCLYP